jgi:AP-1 complex subunit beta-1
MSQGKVVSKLMARVKEMTQRTKGRDGKYFSSSKRGEIPELRAELHSTDKSKQKDAVKKVIAAVTVGKDMSELFPDVVNSIHTEDLEIKKLVYLYLINYAKSKPDMAIMAVNSFVKDSRHPNPLIRALAVRTMGCIRVERISEYLTKPLSSALADEDPYVRKTAAICVAKLHDISPEIVWDHGFLDKLRDAVSDGNPTVVANAVAALAEIQEASGREVFHITSAVLQKLLAALNECTEWGQVFILDALAGYTPGESHEAESIIERVLPRLAHQNSAVVLSAIKIVMKLLNYVSNTDMVNAFSRKLAPPLVTLAQAAQPEVQYVALRNINLVVQKRPGLLGSKVKVFFCKYNDPIYVKMEKLDTLVRLASSRNIDEVLMELKEYAQEVDVEFVRKAVRTIGRCAIKLESAAERCIKVLLQLIDTKVNYVVQEAVVVIRDIFRRYPNRYESVISILCEALSTLDEPEAKAAMIWIIGEYAARIENAGELLDMFSEGFHDEPPAVQLQILTASVKLFLHRPDSARGQVERVLSMTTEESDNPDLRDRGFVYWRLLSSSPDAARRVVLAEKPVIEDDTNRLEPDVLDELIGYMSTLASIYHKPPETFVMKSRAAAMDLGDEDSDSDSDSDEVDEDDVEDEEEYTADAADVGAGGGEADLLGFGGPPAAPSGGGDGSVGTGGGGGGGGGGGLDADLFGHGSGVGGSSSALPPVPAPKSPLGSDKGVTLRGALVRRGDSILLDLDVDNAQATAITTCALKLNVNRWGLAPQSVGFDLGAVPAGGSGSVAIPLVFQPAQVDAAKPVTPVVEAALRDNTSKAVVFFKIPVRAEALFTREGELDKKTFLTEFRGIDDSTDYKAMVSPLVTTDVDQLVARLREHRVFDVAKRPAGDQTVVYASAALASGQHVLVELTLPPGAGSAQLVVKMEDASFGAPAAEGIKRIIAAAQ